MRRAAGTGGARALGAVLALAAALTLFGAGPAQAAGYRYWSFWLDGKESWTYATVGPATHRPADGSVAGFRFAVSENSADSARPRTAPDFAAICGSTPAEPGAKRIALVIDPGTRVDAPNGETPPERRSACARVPESATTAEALAAVAKPLRYNTQALLCGISGYPRTGCGEQVAATGSGKTSADTTADSQATSGAASDDGPALGPLVGVGAIVTLGAAALWQSRRRRR
ncbi:SCO2322 family protein [Streptomyces sp. NPDC000594]|uniref:SCO2322 family protein n=1 Tax=Streptomyces sp. NPDC000594 TaxID=3154261 RepID=UPI00331C51A8